MNVNDRNVVVTGSSRGIGAEIARKFADAGSRVVVSARSQDAIAVSYTHLTLPTICSV